MREVGIATAENISSRSSPQPRSKTRAVRSTHVRAVSRRNVCGVDVSASKKLLAGSKADDPSARH